jgi:hypothetical protein
LPSPYRADEVARLRQDLAQAGRKALRLAMAQSLPERALPFDRDGALLP